MRYWMKLAEDVLAGPVTAAAVILETRTLSMS